MTQTKKYLPAKENILDQDHTGEKYFSWLSDPPDPDPDPEFVCLRVV
jgi:hypothetical protein